MRALTLAAPLAAALAIGAGTAIAAPRAALVIGNETYLTGQPAPGAVEAARAVAGHLARAGFEVVFGRDVDAERMRERLEDFEDHARDADVALVVYIGRVVAFGGGTWLVPVDADADTLLELGSYSTALALPLGIAEKAEASIAVIDGAWPARFDGLPGLGVGAFHEEPGVEPGLAQPAGGASLLVSSTAPGGEPPQREIGHAAFAPSVIEALLAAGRPAAEAAAVVREAMPDAYLHGRVSPEAGGNLVGPVAPDMAGQLRYWQEVSAEGTAEAYARYLREFPDGFYVHAARDRLEDLGAGEAEMLGFAAAAEDQLELSEAQRQKIQAALVSLGYPIAQTDGVFGEDTREAIRDWQLETRREPTGFLSRQGARLLLQSAEDAAAQ